MEKTAKDPLLVAVDALAVELGIGKDGLAFTWDQLECLNRVLDAYAHELAEKIRKAPFNEHLLQGHQRAAAARIIDPEVTE